MKMENIFNQLNQLLNNSYSPYSNFKVAAIIEGDDKKLYNGVNIENASFGGTICAERSGICSAITAGNKKINKIYLLSVSKNFIFPCGICLQFISEFLNENGLIYIFSQDKKYKEYKLNELILSPFISRNIDNE